MSHQGFRFDDYGIWGSFWISINRGYVDMEYKYEFEKFWGKGAKAETIVLSQRDYDALVERLNEPPDPKVMERFREILNKPAPWDK
jgi:5-bromo-4-chloroindolyl phosphate hydrolysis protein